MPCVSSVWQRGGGGWNFTTTSVADTLVVVTGNLYLIVLLLYPLEVVRPGWLNEKRVGMLLLPYVALSLFYYTVLGLLVQKPLKLDDMSQLMEHIGEFNVWCRLLMIVSVMLYLALLFRLTWSYNELYRKWCRENYSDNKDMDISWLKNYGVGIGLTGVTYCWILFDGNTYCFIIHNLTVQMFLLLYPLQGAFHYNSYTEDFFRFAENHYNRQSGREQP